MKKKSLKMLLAGLILCPFIVANAKDAYSIATDYGLGQINTSKDAIYASEAYYAIGFNSYYNTQPTYQYMRGNNPNTGTPRMESEILFFSGHGNYDHMAFNYNNKGGDYLTGVYYRGNWDSPSGYKYAGIESYNMKKVKMIVFAGCKTADHSTSSNNLTINAQYKGARVSLGWEKSVATPSHTQWLYNFNEQLRQGKSFVTAVNSANSKSYADNNVKTAWWSGDGTYTPKNSTYSLNELKNNSTDTKLNNYTTNILFKNDDELSEKVSEYIKENIDEKFAISDYYLEKTVGKELIYYDYKKLIGDAITNSAITVIVKDNKIIEVVDNRLPNFDKQQIMYSSNDKDSKDVKQRAINRITNDNNLEIVDQSIKKVYDESENNFKWYIRTEIFEKNSETYYVDEYYENI